LWKVVLLGIIAAPLIALGAAMSFLPDPSNSVAAYQQATLCSAASIPSDNCYAVVPVTVVSASALHFRKNRPDEVHVIVQAPSGSTEVVLPWESAQDQVLLAGSTGTVDVYRGVPVRLAVGGYEFATLQSPVVEKAQTRWIGWIFLGLGLLFGGAVVLTLSARRRRASVPPRVVEKMNEIQQRLTVMQAQPQRGQITRGQTIGIVIGCAVAVLGALLLRGLH
jgi:hypothetical protein